jgi:hypothetical protein
MKNFARFETQIGDKVYHLFADVASNWGDVKQALADLMKMVGNAEDAQKAVLEAQAKGEVQTATPTPDISPAQVEQPQG